MKLLITGGAGFLGRAIVRDQSDAARAWAGLDAITIYSRDETKQHEMAREFPEACNFVLGDVRDTDLLTAAMVGHDVVIHAAAIKYIPEAEHNVVETVAVNAYGSQNVLEAALRAEVETVIGISTDKACEPVNTYGMTKALMERLFAEYHGRRGMRAVTVRYGNVIGSTGSVIPLFLRQLDEGSITVTDPAMTRFWLTQWQAVDVIWWALQDDHRESMVYVPKVQSLDMSALAYCVMQAAGREGEPQIIGARPGEKQHETLVGLQESTRTHGRPELSGPGFFILPATHGPVYTEQWNYSSDQAERMPNEAMVAAIEDLL